MDWPVPEVWVELQQEPQSAPCRLAAGRVSLVRHLEVLLSVTPARCGSSSENTKEGLRQTLHFGKFLQKAEFTDSVLPFGEIASVFVFVV